MPVGVHIYVAMHLVVTFLYVWIPVYVARCRRLPRDVCRDALVFSSFSFVIPILPTMLALIVVVLSKRPEPRGFDVAQPSSLPAPSSRTPEHARGGEGDTGAADDFFVSDELKKKR